MALDYSGLNQSSPDVMRFVSAILKNQGEEISLEGLKSLLKVNSIPSKEDRMSAYLAVDTNLDGSIGIRDMIGLADRMGLSVEIDAKLKFARKRWRLVGVI